MIIYLETREVFLEHVRRNRIEEEVGERLKAIAGRRVSPAEVRAWRNSFQYVSQFLLDPKIPAALGVAIEYQIHNTSRRIDLLLSGRSPDDRHAAVIVELTHPSYQAWSYSCLPEDFNTAVQEHSIAINPCAYLHNCSDGSGVLAGCYQDYLERAPVFLRHHTDELVGFLTRCLQQGDGGEAIKRIRDGRARPSRQLAELFEQMVLGNSEFTLIEEQKVVYERALQFARKLRPGKRTVLLVRGGPGTGKSVVAIHLMAALLQKGLNIRYVSKNAAPRTVFKAKLTGQAAPQLLRQSLLRLRCLCGLPSRPLRRAGAGRGPLAELFSGLYGNQGENQVKEIINASHLSVFFLDDDQQVAWKDIGMEAEIREHAAQLGAEVVCAELPSQFRCAGSDGYLSWLDDLLGIRSTANALDGRGAFGQPLDPAALPRSAGGPRASDRLGHHQQSRGAQAQHPRQLSRHGLRGQHLHECGLCAFRR